MRTTLRIAFQSFLPGITIVFSFNSSSKNVYSTEILSAWRTTERGSNFTNPLFNGAGSFSKFNQM